MLRSRKVLEQRGEAVKLLAGSCMDQAEGDGAPALELTAEGAVCEC